MNRKIILLPLSVAALLVLGACGKTTTSSAAPVSSAATTSSSKKEAAPTAITAAELIEWNAAQDQTADTKDGDTLFTMSGILEGWDGTNTYGDCYLTDPTSLKSVLVYGSTTTTTCITGTAGSYAFANPQDAKTTLKDYKSGEKATLTFVRECYKGKLEITGYFTAHVADTTKFAVAAPATVDNGTYTIDKTTAAYGETVTVTTAPAAGYGVKSVMVTTAYGEIKATVDATDATKYTFGATCVNTVVVTFEAAARTSSSWVAASGDEKLFFADSKWQTAVTLDKIAWTVAYTAPADTSVFSNGNIPTSCYFNDGKGVGLSQNKSGFPVVTFTTDISKLGFSLSKVEIGIFANTSGTGSVEISVGGTALTVAGTWGNNSLGSFTATPAAAATTGDLVIKINDTAKGYSLNDIKLSVVA